MSTFQSNFNSFSKRLQKLNENLQAVKKFGIDEDILVCYLCQKLKISQKEARKIINCVDEFYDKIVLDAAIEGL